MASCLVSLFVYFLCIRLIYCCACNLPIGTYPYIEIWIPGGYWQCIRVSYCIAVLDPGTHQTIINNAVIIFNVFSATQPAANRIGMRLRIPVIIIM